MQVKWTRKMVTKFVNSRLFENSIIISVVLNTVILSFDGLFLDQQKNFDIMNSSFTYIFAIEMGLKLYGFGVKSKKK